MRDTADLEQKTALCICVQGSVGRVTGTSSSIISFPWCHAPISSIWLALVNQYSLPWLQGRFAEFWEAAGVQAGDTLSFRYDPATAKVTVLRYAPAPSGVAEQVSCGPGGCYFPSTLWAWP